MKKRKLAILLLLILFAPVLLHKNVFAQRIVKLYVGYVGNDAPQLPAWSAKEAGIFQKNGLDVQLVNFTGGPTAIAALLSGDVPITQVSGPSVVSSNLRGSDVVLVAGGTVTLDVWLMSRPEIKTAEQLKGGTIGIARFGGVNDATLRFLLPKLGITPGKDVTITQVGGVPLRLAALEARRIQASLLSPPVSLTAKKRGLNVLADVAAMGMVYQHTSVATTRRFIRENPDIIRRYVKSQIEAVHRLKTDRNTGVEVLAKYLGGSKDKDILEKAYDRAVADDQLPAKQYPTLVGIKAILDGLVGQDPKAKLARPEDFVDMQFIKELDQNGFIDILYGRGLK